MQRKINSQQCQGEPSALPAQPGQAQSLGDISLLAVWGSSTALTPAEAGHTPQDIPQGSVVVHLGPLGLAGGTGRCTSALFPPPREDRGTRTGGDSSEAGRRKLRLVIPWVREVAGGELCRAWLSSPALFDRTLLQVAGIIWVKLFSCHLSSSRSDATNCFSASQTTGTLLCN